MKRAVWLLILGLLFALTGCGKEAALQEPFSPQQVVLYARWSEGEYCVVSRSADGGVVQVDGYDAELSPLESVTAGSWQELQGNLPPDFCAADRERGVRGDWSGGGRLGRNDGDTVCLRGRESSLQQPAEGRAVLEERGRDAEVCNGGNCGFGVPGRRQGMGEAAG